MKKHIGGWWQFYCLVALALLLFYGPMVSSAVYRDDHVNNIIVDGNATVDGYLVLSDVDTDGKWIVSDAQGLSCYTGYSAAVHRWHISSNVEATLSSTGFTVADALAGTSVSADWGQYDDNINVGPGAGDIKVDGTNNRIEFEGATNDAYQTFLTPTDPDTDGDYTVTIPAATGTIALAGAAHHDGFSDFVAAEHVDWAGASAGTIHTDNYVEGSTPNLFYGYDNVGGQSLQQAQGQVTVNIDTGPVDDSYFSLASDQITVSEAGLYEIHVDCGWTQTDTAGDARGGAECRIQKDTGGGMANITDAVAGQYSRETTTTFTAHIMTIQTLSSGDKIQVTMEQTDNDMHIETMQYGTRIFMRFIR